MKKSKKAIPGDKTSPQIMYEEKWWENSCIGKINRTLEFHSEFTHLDACKHAVNTLFEKPKNTNVVIFSIYLLYHYYRDKPFNENPFISNMISAYFIVQSSQYEFSCVENQFVLALFTGNVPVEEIGGQRMINFKGSYRLSRTHKTMTDKQIDDFLIGVMTTMHIAHFRFIQKRHAANPLVVMAADERMSLNMDEFLDFLYDPEIVPVDFNMPYEHIQLTDLVIGDTKTTRVRAERQFAPLQKLIREGKWGKLSSPTFSSLIERACEHVLTTEEQQEVIYDINIFGDCANHLLDSVDKIISICQYNPELVVEIAVNLDHLGQSLWIPNTILNFPINTTTIDVVKNLFEKDVIRQKILKEYVMMVIEYFDVDTDIAPLEYLVMTRFIHLIESIMSKDQSILDETIQVNLKQICIQYNTFPQIRKLFQILNILAKK